MDYKKGFKVKPKETNRLGEVTFTDGTYDFPPNQLQCEAYGYKYDKTLGVCSAFKYNNKVNALLNNKSNNVRGGEALVGTENSLLNGEGNITKGDNRNAFITGQENLRWIQDSTFTSKYEAGDFLYTHTDKDNGRIAFVYQLTKDWLPGYGGLFMRMDDGVNVDTTILPQFNQLTIFNVEGEGTPHIVTNVIPGLRKPRMAYSGWLA